MLIPLSGDGVTEEVQRLLRPSHGSLEATERAVAMYRSGDWVLFGWIEDGRLTGCVGFEVEGPRAMIRSISVDPAHQRHGIGRAMVQAALEEVKAAHVEAETDRDAAGFYQRLGFSLTTIGDAEHGVERFRCERRG